MNTKKISVLLAVDQNNMPIGILHKTSTIYCAQVLHETVIIIPARYACNPVSRETIGGTDPA